MPINWGVEVIKWQTVINKVNVITLKFSTKAVLLGIVFSMYTPNRVGEYGGRIFLLKEKRLESFFATMMGSISQIAANTFWSGLLTLFFIFNILPTEESKEYYFPIVLISVLSTLLLYFFIEKLSNFNFLIFKKIKGGIDIFKQFSLKEKQSLYTISSTRFFIYVLQYYCLLQFFDVNIPFFLAIVSIGCVFFVQTIIPSIAMVELGLRGIISINIFGYLSNNVAGILDSTFTIWILNLVFPAILGLIVLLKTNLNQQEEHPI